MTAEWADLDILGENGVLLCREHRIVENTSQNRHGASINI
jgi:hypothetical protein